MCRVLEIRSRSWFPAASGLFTAALCALVFAGSSLLAPATPAQQADDERLVVATNDPAALLELVPGRVDLFADDSPARSESVSDEAEIRLRQAAVAWLREAFAPISTQPACIELFQRRGLTLPRADQTSYPPGRPLASPPDASTILMPIRLPPLGEIDLELLRASGLLPFEVALTGEWARSMAARHAGPVPKDPLLRQARAARLEGTARLAGLIAQVRGTNIEPAELGRAILLLDRGLAGIPRAVAGPASADTKADRVLRATSRVFFEDGLRWALLHYLRGGAQALAEALERPAIGPEGLLRPGSRRPSAQPPDGCRLGPRGATALLLDDDDPPWISDLVGDSFVSKPDGSLLGWLGFETADAARRAAIDLTNGGVRVDVRESVLVLSLDPTTGSGSD